jgi:hypothetical protein
MEQVLGETDCCLVASDLHAGSIFALMRPGFVTEECNEIGLNPFQRWLWAQFESCLDEKPEDRDILRLHRHPAR